MAQTSKEMAPNQKDAQERVEGYRDRDPDNLTPPTPPAGIQPPPRGGDGDGDGDSDH
jgi:hypothetical protein